MTPQHLPRPSRPPRRRRLGTGTALTACLTLVLGLLVTLAPGAHAVTLPTGFSQSTYAAGMGRVTAMAFAPDGRLFVIEQDGAVRVVRDGKVLDRPFLTLDVDARGERGLTGIALDPGFASNGWVYLYYTVPGSPAHNRVSRFVADGDEARRSDGALVERRVLDLEPLSSSLIHNGGAMSFGPDRKLYIAVGENADGAKAQSLSSRFGKVLRVNADGSIPGDNPFVGRGATGDNAAIWAMGLRNPFTFGFSRGGRLLINDVGQSQWEEINEGAAGANYGWPATEGPTDDDDFESPLYAYGHEDGDVTGCAITGGTFYDPSTSRYPSDYVGDYFFADFCDHWIKRLDLATGKVTGFATATSPHPVDLEVGPDGNLYYLSRGDRSVVRVSFSSSQLPTITQQPSDLTVTAGEAATFTAAAAGAAPLRYQWQRDGRAITGATSATYRLPSVADADDGDTFGVVVSNASGSVTSRSATLTVTDDRPPTATITSPATDTEYSGGDVVEFAGTGTDPETGALPAGAFTWQVDFHHADHSHPFVAPFSGVRSGSFTVPRTGHVDSDVWYRIRLTVEDAAGRTVETFRDVEPRTVGLTVATEPAGLRVAVDDQPRTTPHREQAVVGLRRKLSAPATQSKDGVSYRFVSWSDGGAASHEITVPASARTYTAVYRAADGGGGQPGGGTPPPVVTPPSSPGGPGVPVGPDDEPATTRLAGADRYATAASISRDSFPAGPVPVAFVVTGAAHADGLAGGPAADRLGGPVLPVTRTAVPRPVLDELTRLRPGRIVVLGGADAVGDAVVDRLRDLTAGTVTRIAGADRYATAAQVATTVFPGPVPQVFVATGTDFPDALAGGAAAARTDSPVLLVAPDGVPAATAAALRQLRPGRVVVLGGTTAVPAAVADELRALTGGAAVERVAGSDRYATAARAAQVFWPQTANVVHLATGRDFPDALAGIPAAGRDLAPLLLVEPTCMPAVTKRELDRLRPATLVVLGGPSAVSAAAVAGTVCGATTPG